MLAAPATQAFLADLPFELRRSQRHAIDEITHDLAGGAPMHRLLQGEVGSGKTVVALTALLVAAQGGYQGAFLAPTEVLADQHQLTLRDLVGDLTVAAPGNLLGDQPVRVALLTGSTPAAERRRLLAGLDARDLHIVVGTHALLDDRAVVPRLGVVVI